MRLKVKSQIHDKEARQKGLLDDCGPAATAAAIGWVTGADLDVTALVKEYEKVGRVDQPGVLSAGTTFAQNIKIAGRHGAKGVWPKSWEQVLAAARKGAAIILNVQAPKGYPAARSAWTKRWIAYWTKKDPARVAKGFGHYVAVAYDPEDGWQYADPTMTGKGKEALAFKIAEADFRAMAEGKGRPKHSACVIITAKKPAPVPAPAPAPVPAPTTAPAKPPVAAVRRIFGRIFGRRISL